ncbi:MAG: PilX N-terminal domain-containing pilus assembly protein [Gammaproteobacteria bacterium]|jgi:type IV pilus assembly protein PilX|nr:PilX N-terminal domain-containing pilus assembly protein [Gammaproteobacteria bacterium]
MQTSVNISSLVPRERGVALVMAMVFLLILTLIGVTTMSTTVLEERMAGNMQDKNTAFQAAESALTSGENWLRPLAAIPIFDPLVTNDGLHRQSAISTPVWDVTTGVWSGTDVVDYTELPGAGSPPSGQLLSLVNQQPRYLIEDLGPVRDPLKSIKLGTPSRSTRNVFRITARGTGSSDQAMAMVQSVFEKQF